MKKFSKRKILLYLGLSPFVVAILWTLYSIVVDGWSPIDWIFLYSYIYWPTYAVGLVLILISLNMKRD